LGGGAAERATRLLFRDTPVRFPMDLPAVRSYADAPMTAYEASLINNRRSGQRIGTDPLSLEPRLSRWLSMVRRIPLAAIEALACRRPSLVVAACRDNTHPGCHDDRRCDLPNGG
jgi:hypothetical protein